MIINCALKLIRLLNPSLAINGYQSFHTSFRPLSKYKVYLKKPKTVPKCKIVIWKGMQVVDLANAMNVEVARVMEAVGRVLKSDQKMTRRTELRDVSLISDVAKMCGYSVVRRDVERVVETEDKDAYCRNINLNSETVKSRPPVVTIMGHVDHGKTTLLDSLRSTRVVDSEFGGITQHIGAFKVKLSDISGTDKGGNGSDNDVVTFLDTPGHAAFSLMRSRGVRCTDIVVLVVAVDDGLMPQTIESIRFAKEARVPMIVVMNKVDKLVSSRDHINLPQYNDVYERIRQSLSKHGVVVEEYGGSVQCFPVSALRMWNLDHLQESILALAEMLNIRSDYGGLCEGVVLETKFVDHFGKQATVLVHQGSVKVGSILVCGHSWARVRTIKNDGGRMVSEGWPGDAVEVTGWRDGMPSAGDVVLEVESEARAKEVLSYRRRQLDGKKAARDYEEYNRRMESYRANYKAYVEEGYRTGVRQMKDRPQLMEFESCRPSRDGVVIPQVNLIVKTDVYGSLEAIENVLSLAIESCADQCCIKVAHIAVGNLTESDVRLATFTNSIVYLFNLPHSPHTESGLGIDVRHFNVIYHMFDDLRDYVTTQLPPLSQCDVVGEAELLQMFEIRESRTKVSVLGCKCTSGAVHRDRHQYFYRVLRPASVDNGQVRVIHDHLTCQSLRHMRTDVDTIRKGLECGIVLVHHNGDPVVALEPGDLVQCCRTVFSDQKLNWDLGYQ